MSKNLDLTPLAGVRQDTETDNAVVACNDWLRLGAGRSFPALVEKYAAQNQTKPPTRSRATIKIWSMKFDWAARASEYDAGWEEVKDAERAEVMRSGLALDYERVRKLTALAAFLEKEMYTKDAAGQYINVWLADVKQIGSGDNAERVDIVRFNTGLIDQYRATLDDLAKETGGRINKTDITSDGGAIKPVVFLPAIDEE